MNEEELRRNILAPHHKACQCLLPILPQCDIFLIIVFPVWQIALLRIKRSTPHANRKKSYGAWYLSIFIRSVGHRAGGRFALLDRLPAAQQKRCLNRCAFARNKPPFDFKSMTRCSRYPELIGNGLRLFVNPDPRSHTAGFAVTAIRIKRSRSVTVHRSPPLIRVSPSRWRRKRASAGRSARYLPAFPGCATNAFRNNFV